MDLKFYPGGNVRDGLRKDGLRMDGLRKEGGGGIFLLTSVYENSN